LVGIGGPRLNLKLFGGNEMVRILEDEFRINENSSGITAAAGVANSESDIWTFIVPDSTSLILRPGDIFSVLLQDSAGPTGLATTSQVKLVYADANGIITRELVSSAYTTVTEFQDRNSIMTLGRRTEVSANQQIIIRVTGDLAVSTADSIFQLSTLRGTVSIL
jgi:hypothetical protein